MARITGFMAFNMSRSTHNSPVAQYVRRRLPRNTYFYWYTYVPKIDARVPHSRYARYSSCLVKGDPYYHAVYI